MTWRTHFSLARCSAVWTLFAVCMAIGPWATSGIAGTITSGTVSLPNLAGFSYAGATPATVSEFGDISTAQAFLFTDVANLSTVSNPAAGYFYGIASKSFQFNSVAFEFTSTGVNTSASFSSPFFGSFQSSFAVQVSNSDTGLQKNRVFDVYGTYTNGTVSQSNFPAEVDPRGDTSPNPVAALWRISLNQQSGAGQTISFSSTLSFPVAVPEPGTSTLAVVGVAALAAVHVSRRRVKAPSESPSA